MGNRPDSGLFRRLSGADLRAPGGGAGEKDLQPPAGHPGRHFHFGNYRHCRAYERKSPGGYHPGGAAAKTAPGKYGAADPRQLRLRFSERRPGGGSPEGGPGQQFYWGCHRHLQGAGLSKGHTGGAYRQAGEAGGEYDEHPLQIWRLPGRDPVRSGGLRGCGPGGDSGDAGLRQL